MEYEKKYNDLIARINEVKEKPSLCMKKKHHYNGYVETGIRDALDYIVSPESEDERIRKHIIKILDGLVPCHWDGNEKAKCIAYLVRQKEYIEDIRQYAYNKGLVDAEEKHQPAEWSEEDKKALNRAINICRNDFGEYSETAKFLKSLPKRFNLQPQQEWSEEDEQYLLICDNALAKYCSSEHWSYPTISKWLGEHCKVLSQPHWKPSKEQMEALMLAIEGKWEAIMPTGYMSRRLEDLYEGLANTFQVECKLEK